MEREKRILHLYATDEEWLIISNALDKAAMTDVGKIRAGDTLRNVLMKVAEELK